MFGFCKSRAYLGICAKTGRRYMGGVGVPSSYFDIANREVNPSISRSFIRGINPALVFLVVGGDASGKTTLIDNLIRKFTHEHDIKPVTKAPINPFELCDKIKSNKVIFIDIHELNYEMFHWINSIKFYYRSNYGFVMIHPHVSMSTYRSRVTEKSINDSLELRFGITQELFQNDVMRHITCANSLYHFGESFANAADISILYENNTSDKEIVSISSGGCNYIYNPNLLKEAFGKRNLNVEDEIKLVHSFYRTNYPYDHWRELNPGKLMNLKETKPSKNRTDSIFFPEKLNNIFDAICHDYKSINKGMDKKDWFPTFNKFAKNLQNLSSKV